MNLINPNKTYNTDKKVVYSCQYHVIFCTKYRRKVLIDNADNALKAIILENQDKLGYKVLEMEVMPDHVHLLVDTNPRTGIYKQVSRMKGISSKLLRKQFRHIKSRLPSLWTRSCFISTVGSASLEVVKSYIEDQKKN